MSLAEVKIRFTGSTPYTEAFKVKERPYTRFETQTKTDNLQTFGPNNPTFCSSSANGHSSAFAADGELLTGFPFASRMVIDNITSSVPSAFMLSVRSAILRQLSSTFYPARESFPPEPRSCLKKRVISAYSTEKRLLNSGHIMPEKLLSVLLHRDWNRPK